MGYRSLIALVALAAAACGSTAQEPPASDPSSAAPPLDAELRRRAREGGEQPAADAGSASRPLAYVNGAVVTYRDVLLRVGPQLSVLGEDEQKRALEAQALIDILRDRIVYAGAVDAGVEVSRDEQDREFQRRVDDLQRNGGQLEAFLLERGLSRREYMDRIQRDIRMQRFMISAIGLGGGSARVRPMTDVFVAPGEVRKYYERHPERFEEPAHAKVRVMKFRTDLTAPDRAAAQRAAESRARAARARLLAGEDWVPIYRANLPADEVDDSDGLEVIQRGEKAEWIEEFAFDSPRGTLSDVIPRGRTFYLLRAEGASPQRTVPYEEVHEDIRTQLGRIRRQMATYEVELKLLEGAAVKPPALKERLRSVLRDSRRKLLTEYDL